MHHLFISYSRHDRPFVERLSQALIASGKTTWVDWRDIPPTATFMEEIRRAIEAADSFLWVISPDSCKSVICRQELEHAAKNNKRLIPVVCRTTPDTQVPPELAPINWITFDGGVAFDDALARLTTAIDTDLKWVRAHTELLVRATDWEQLQRARSGLLRGIELTAAEQRLVEAAIGKQPPLTPLQQEFVIASRRNATRTLRSIVAAVSSALVVTAVLAVVAFRQRNRAESEKNRAEDAARLIVAGSLAETDPTSAALVLLELHDPSRQELAALSVLHRVAEQPISSSVLRGHVGHVSAGAFSPDGRQVVTASDDGTARIWSADGRGTPIVLRGHEDKVTFAAFSPDGRRVVTASADRTARVWPADGHDAPVVLRGHADTVRSATFSADGTRIVTRSEDRTVRVWHSDGSGEPVVLRVPEGRINAAALSPDGRRIVTASSDGTARLWATDGRSDPIVLRGHEANVYSAAFSPDGTRVVTSSDDRTARVWRVDGEGEPVVLRGHALAVMSAAFSPDGGRIVTTSLDNTVRVWPADGREVPVVLRGHQNAIGSAAFSPDGTRIVTTSDDRTARVWPADGRGSAIVLRGHDGPVYSAAFSPDGTRVVTTASDGTARIWLSAGSGEPVVLRGHADFIVDASFNRDGQPHRDRVR